VFSDFASISSCEHIVIRSYIVYFSVQASQQLLEHIEATNAQPNIAEMLRLQSYLQDFQNKLHKMVWE
jgi:hypothetical protein